MDYTLRCPTLESIKQLDEPSSVAILSTPRMHESIGVRALKSIASEEPRRSSDALLRLLIEQMGADAACLFRLNGDLLSLFVGCSLTQADLDRATEAWADSRESILAGHAFTDDQFALVPIAEAPAGLLYVGAQHALNLDMAAIEEVLPILRSALEAVDRPSKVDRFLESSSDDDLERGRMLVLLRRHEWNIARVSRAMGVHRLTIYKRMKRLGIPREKVKKTKPRPRRAD